MVAALKYIVAIAIALGLLAWGASTAHFIIDLVDKDGLRSEIKRAEYQKFGDFYNHLLMIGVALGGAFSLVIFFWNKHASKEGKRFLIYVLFLLILMPLSFANYVSADIFFDRWKQAFLDLIMSTLGLIVLLKLLKTPSHSDETRVMKALAIFFVSSQAILVPGIYGILWFLNIQTGIAAADTEDLTMNWITGLTAIGGLVISILNYRLSVKQSVTKS